MHRTIKIQHEHQTSTSALQMLNPYIDKNDWLVLTGKKTSRLRKFAVGKKVLQNFWSERISMPRVRQNLRNKINKLHCFRPLSRDNGGVDKIQPCGVLPAVTVIHLTSDNQKKCVALEYQIFCRNSALIFCRAVLKKEEMISKKLLTI